MPEEVDKTDDRTVEVEVAGRKMDLGKDLAVSEGGFGEAVRRHSSILGWWTQLLQTAVSNADKVKLSRQILEAELDMKVRASFEKEAVRYTEAKVRSTMILQPSWQEKMEEELAANRDMKVLDAACRALESKTRMLETYGYHRRGELNAEVEILRLKHENRVSKAV